MLHPSRPVIAARQIPPISWCSRQRPYSRSSGERIAQCQWAEDKSKAQNTKSEPTSPTRVLDVAWHVTPPPGFQGVTACLRRSPSPKKAHDIPPDPLQITAVLEPTMAMMSASCIIMDEATGVTYMDTITTSVGRVALSGPEQGTPSRGPIIEDITDLGWWANPWPPLGGRVGWWLPLGRRVGWWPPLGRKVKMPFGGNYYKDLNNFNFSYMPW